MPYWSSCFARMTCTCLHVGQQRYGWIDFRAGLGVVVQYGINTMSVTVRVRVWVRVRQTLLYCRTFYFRTSNYQQCSLGFGVDE